MGVSKVVFIGAGNVATHFAKAFQQNGFKVEQIYSRTETSASLLADALSTSYTTSLENVVQDADLYVVSLKDAVVQTLIPDIVKGREEALFVHTAGSLPMQVWEGFAKHYGVLYPMQTFSKKRLVDFKDVPFFIEANKKEVLEQLKAIVECFSPKVFEASTEQRKYLHLAAVFACNFSNHMYALSDYLLKNHGIPFEVMYPLIDETVRKVHELKPKEAQTGPAIRYDENVINRHLMLLEDEPIIKELYEKISKSIHHL